MSGQAKHRNAIAVAAALVLFATGAAGNGTTATEIVVGTHLDLSGPLAPLGTSVRNGLVMAFDEIDASGGIYGRKLKLIAQDDRYSASRAEAVTRTLLSDDHVFAMLCPVGTPTVARTTPMVLNSGTLQLFPFTDDAQTPVHPLAFALDLPSGRQIAIGLDALLSMRGALKVGVLYRDDALGEAVLDGARAGRADLVAAASFPPGATRFGPEIAKLRRAGAELVVIGGVAQEAIAALKEAADEAWFPVFLCDDACYVPQLPPLGGPAVSGLYAVAATPIPYPDDRDLRIRTWVARYEQRFGMEASAEAFRAYLDARVFAEALRRAGPDPGEARVAHALESLSHWQDPQFGGIPVDFSARDHSGLHTGFLAQVRQGRWATLSGPLGR